MLIISSRFDLKAAIDTFPSLLLGKMLIGVFGFALAAAWMGSGLVANMFRAKAHRREGYCLVAFGTGQPLGFYGSWTLFTLAHHNTVWLSTELVDPGSGFTAYAILGYYIVIGDAEVAAMYQKVVAISDDSDFKSSDLRK